MQEEEIKTTTEETSANDEVREEVTEETAAEANAANETTEAKEEQQEPVTDEKDEKITELQNRYMRLQADFDNFRRRTATE